MRLQLLAGKMSLTAALLITQVTLAAADFSKDSFDNPSVGSASAYDQSLTEVQISDRRSMHSNTGAISPTTKFTKEDIQRSGVTNVDQLLLQVPGLQVSRTGGPGSTTSYFLRGSESDTTLVLLNDVRIQSANTGFSLISDLQIHSIESIEVIRGAQSALYGSAAPGGIIKIYTTPQTNKTSGTLNTSGSNQGDITTALSGSGELQDGVFVFGNGHWSNSDGIDACSLNSACFVSEPESDLDGRELLNGQIGFTLANDYGRSVQVSQLYTNARQEFDGDFANESESTQKVTNLRWEQPINQDHSLAINAGQFDEFFEGLGPELDSEDPATRFQYGTQRYTSSLVHEFNTQGNTKGLSFISGLDLDQSRLEDSDTIPDVDRRSTGIFSELQYASNGATLRIGGRRDRYEEDQIDLNETQTNYATTGHVKLMFELSDNVALKSSIGRNFNMPTFSELYFPGFSNPDLGPETHTSQDIGLEYQAGGFTSALFYFHTKSSDLIIFDGTTLNSVGEARIEGVELSSHYRANNISLGADVTWLDAQDRTEANFGNELPRRPSLQFAGHMSYQINQTTARLGAIATNSRFDNLGNTQEVPGFAVFDLGFTHQATRNLQLGLRVDNLLDKDYETVLGYNQPDRSVWLELEYAIR